MSNPSSPPPTKRSSLFGLASTPFSWPTLDPTSSSTMLWEEDSVESKMKDFQKSRREAVTTKGNLWTSQIQEENEKELMDQFQGVAVEETLVIDRGSESYYVKNRRKRKMITSVTDDKKDSTTKEKEATDYDSEHSDYSDTGLDDDDLEHIRKMNKGMKMEMDAEDEKSQQQQQSAGPSKQVYHKKSISRIDTILTKVKDYNLYKFIAKQLQETFKQDIVAKCVEKLGREHCVHKFRKTLKIECKGGLMIKNQTRRRTPGGVFFYLIRMDTGISPAVINEIFPPQPLQGADGKGNQKWKGKSSSVFQKMSDNALERRKTGSKFASASNIELEKKRKVVSKELDAESYRVAPPSFLQNQSLDPRATKMPLVTYDDLF